MLFFMYRNIFKDNILDRSFIDKKLMPGDKKTYFSLITNGKIYCFQDTMSAYRHVVSHGSSYSANVKYNIKTENDFLTSQLFYSYKINNKKAIICSELMYLAFLRNSFFKGRCNLSYVIKNIKNINHKFNALFWLLKRDVDLKIKKECIKI